MAAVTEVSAASNPGWNAGSLGVRAASAARCPPAELPATNSTVGSAPYSRPCSRTQATIFLASTWQSGNAAAGASRYLTLTHTHPWLASRDSRGGPRGSCGRCGCPG